MHPKITFDWLDSLYGETEERFLAWTPVRSSFNIWCGEYLRSKLKTKSLVSGQIESQLIVWGRGEAQDIGLTKLGGNVIWTRASDLPTDLTFVGQIGLMDSPEVLKMTKGDVLSIWADNKFPFGKIEVFQLDSRDIGYVTGAEVNLSVANKQPFYGAAYNSFDLEHEIAQRLGEYEFEGKYRRLRFTFSPWMATKIGGIPSSSQNRKGFICQICSVQAVPEKPFPWVNSAPPLQVNGLPHVGYGAPENRVPIGDAGVLTLFLSKRGMIDIELTMS